MPQKLRSAPPRMASKQTNATKEIEAWIQKDNEYGPAHDVQRVSGKLSDNVTEERLLHAKLLELGKERYKFLVQNTYEKQMFLERQKRKSAPLKAHLSQVHFSRRKSTAKKVESSEEHEVVQHAEKSDEPRQPAKEIGFTSTELCAGIHIQTGRHYVHNPVKVDTVEAIRGKKADTSSEGVQTWAKRGKNRRRKLSNDLMKDPRYVDFHDALYPAYLPEQKLDVSTIVQNIGSLHIPPKMPKHGRSRLGEKLQIFMKERGIVF